MVYIPVRFPGGAAKGGAPVAREEIMRVEVIKLGEYAIDTVRGAETKAEEIARSAAQEAAKLVADAQNEAVRIENTGGDEARAQQASAVATAQSESRQALEKAMAALDAKMETLAQTARGKQAEAVRVILEALV